MRSGLLVAIGVETRGGEESPDPPARGAPWPGAALAAAAAGLWLISRPFTFSENDGRIYLLMALARNDPGRYADDLFLKFGSQDRYSVFSEIYALAVRLAGPSWGTMGLLLIAAALWLWGSWRLLRRLTDPARAGAGLLLLAGLTINYGGFSTLYVGENFLTARIYAEAFGLLGLSLAVDGAWFGSAAVLLLAALFHPLTAMGAVAVAWLLLIPERPGAFWLGLGAAIAVGALSLAGAQPFGSLLTTMDPAWLAAVKGRNGFVFLSNWTSGDWATLLTEALAVGLAALRVQGRPRTMLLATIGAAAAGLLASWIGADVLHNALVIQLQLWRLTWMLAWASAPTIAILAPRTTETRRWIVPVCLGLTLVFQMGWPGFALAAACFAGGVLRRPATKLVSSVILFLASAFLIVAIAVLVIALVRRHYFDYPDLTQTAELLLRRSLTWLLAAPLAVSMILGFARARWASPILLAVGLLTWDQRVAFDRYLLDGRPPITVSGPVLWGAVSSPAWFLLRTPSFLGFEQASGLLFSRRTALAWYGRLPHTRGIVPDLVWRPGMKPSCVEVRRIIRAQDVQAMCHDPKGPRTVILFSPAGGLPARSFSTPVPIVTHCEANGRVDTVTTNHFFAYDCLAVRAGDQSRSISSQMGEQSPSRFSS